MAGEEGGVDYSDALWECVNDFLRDDFAVGGENAEGGG